MIHQTIALLIVYTMRYPTFFVTNSELQISTCYLFTYQDLKFMNTYIRECLITYCLLYRLLSESINIKL